MDQSTAQQPENTTPVVPTAPTTPAQTSDATTPAETVTPASNSAPTATPNVTTPPPPSTPATPTAPSMPSGPQPKHSFALKTIILIVVLAILAGILLVVAINPFKKSPVTTKTSMQPTPTVSPAHSILTMAIDTTAASGTGMLATKAVDVNVDTNTNKISGVQFEIAFDPTVLANVTVKPGAFFTNPLTLLNQVDTKNGKINFAVGIQPTAEQAQGAGTVAVISYTVLPTATSTVTQLRFLPKTQVIQQGVLGSVLDKSIDLAVPIDGLTPAAKGNVQTTTQQ